MAAMVWILPTAPQSLLPKLAQIQMVLLQGVASFFAGL